MGVIISSRLEHASTAKAVQILLRLIIAVQSIVYLYYASDEVLLKYVPMQLLPLCRDNARGSVRLLALASVSSYRLLVLAAGQHEHGSRNGSRSGASRDSGRHGYLNQHSNRRVEIDARPTKRIICVSRHHTRCLPDHGESPGLQKFEGTLTVQVQQDAVVDLTLQIAQAAVTVDVQDVTPMVRMDSPTLGHALERKRIEQCRSTAAAIRRSSRPFPASAQQDAYRPMAPAGYAHAAVRRLVDERSVGRLGCWPYTRP